MWLANHYFAHDSLVFPVLLRFCDVQSGRSFHPLHRHLGPVARTWRCPFHSYSCGVASAQAPTPDCESLPATIAEFIRVGPHPCRLDGALGASNSSAPFRNCTRPSTLLGLHKAKLLDFRTYFNNHRTHESLEGRTPDTPVSRPVANLRSFRWQPHLRSLYQTPVAA